MKISVEFNEKLDSYRMAHYSLPFCSSNDAAESCMVSKLDFRLVYCSRLIHRLPRKVDKHFLMFDLVC